MTLFLIGGKSRGKEMTRKTKTQVGEYYLGEIEWGGVDWIVWLRIGTGGELL
jgi:hypothetical protein